MRRFTRESGGNVIRVTQAVTPIIRILISFARKRLPQEANSLSKSLAQSVHRACSEDRSFIQAAGIGRFTMSDALRSPFTTGGVCEDGACMPMVVVVAVVARDAPRGLTTRPTEVVMGWHSVREAGVTRERMASASESERPRVQSLDRSRR